jgi:hypothetical protein
MAEARHQRMPNTWCCGRIFLIRKEARDAFFCSASSGLFSQSSGVRSIAFELSDTGGGQIETNGAFLVAQESAIGLYS